MAILYLDTLTDERLSAYTRLTETQLRNKLEPEKGIFIAESEKVIERAFSAGYEPVSLLMEEKWLTRMSELIERIQARFPLVPLFVLPHDQLEQLCGFELTRGALAAFKRPALLSPRELLKDARRVAILEDITNHTNVGAIFRCAAALNIDAILVTPSCYDPLYRRAVRVSMGCVFQVPWTRIGGETDAKATGKSTWATAGIPELRDMGFTTLALALSDNAVLLGDPELSQHERLALILGTEGEGLSDTTLALCDKVVCIPMAHGVDSLNVAAASAVAFWELRERK